MKALALSWGLEFLEPSLECFDANKIKWVDYEIVSSSQKHIP